MADIMASAKEYYSYLKQINQQNNSFSNQQAQKQMNFQKQMSNTAHQREVSDLKKAGLNPVLSAGGGGGGGASSPSGAMGDVDTSGPSALTNYLMGLIQQQTTLSAAQLQHQTQLSIAEMQARTAKETAMINAGAITSAARINAQSATDVANINASNPNSLPGLVRGIMQQFGFRFGSGKDSSVGQTAAEKVINSIINFGTKTASSNGTVFNPSEKNVYTLYDYLMSKYREQYHGNAPYSYLQFISWIESQNPKWQNLVTSAARIPGVSR